MQWEYAFLIFDPSYERITPTSKKSGIAEAIWIDENFNSEKKVGKEAEELLSEKTSSGWEPVSFSFQNFGSFEKKPKIGLPDRIEIMLKYPKQQPMPTEEEPSKDILSPETKKHVEGLLEKLLRKASEDLEGDTERKDKDE